MGIEYESIFRNKVESFLPRLKVEKLSELGIEVVLITFSQGFDAFTHSFSPKGELVFIFAKTDQIREKEKKVFESVITHELFHGYVTHKLGLGISDKLRGPFSFLERCAATLAEDIQLDKIAVRNNVRILLDDEIIRETIYYEKTAPLTTDNWNTLPEGAKIMAMTSVTWAYAVQSWFAQVLSATGARKQLEENLRLIHPHFVKYGYPYLKDLILRLFDEKTVETGKELEDMVKRLLGAYDKYSDAHGFMLY
jgi:DNA-binding Lrp family transcriptional regulator